MGSIFSSTSELDLTFPLIIPSLTEGQRIDAVLAKLLPTFSRSQLGLWIKEGKITLNSKKVKPKEQVYGGETIHFCLNIDECTKRVEHWEAENLTINIVYEDTECIVINKPAGLVVHPGAGNFKHTLVNGLLHYHPPLQNLPRAGIVHRLDKDTTGLLVVAKTFSSYTSLVRQMQAREIKRHYRCLVHGHIIAGGQISTFYGRHPKNRLKMAVCKQGREAITLYSVAKHYESYTLVDVHLLTGRTHQIRVHMAHIKHAIVGDQLYGANTRFSKNSSPTFREALTKFERQALHACTLAFQHPSSNELLTFEAPLPDDFKNLLQILDL